MRILKQLDLRRDHPFFFFIDAIWVEDNGEETLETLVSADVEEIKRQLTILRLIARSIGPEARLILDQD